ncbi:MAG: M28 family peptidase, partial [Candidatus Hodarchaeota archaeon]
MVVTDRKNMEYMLGFITKICDECGGRIACSDEEHKASQIIKEECEKFADEVKYDPFKTAFHAYPRGFIRTALGLCTIAMGLFPTILHFASFFLALLALLVVVFELMVMLEFIDPFYKKGTSYNAFGRIKPQKETKMLLVFGGHTDSAYHVPLAEKYGQDILKYLLSAVGAIVFAIGVGLLKFIFAFAVPNAGYMNLGSLWGFFRWTIFDYILFLPMIVWYPFVIWVVTHYVSNKPVLGANDNLSAVAAAMAIGHWAKKNRPKHVEVWAGSFGAEECGQRGSKAFVKKYGLEEKILNNSHTVVLESVSGLGYGLLSSESMYLSWPSLKPVIHSKETVDKM